MGSALRFEWADPRYHVVARGNERWDVFCDGSDREHFSACCGVRVAGGSGR
jgi:hypothetical protein